MDNSLIALCDALKKILNHLKPQTNPLSFLLMTGKISQGKTALLKQGNLIHYPIDDDSSAGFYYNQQGIILNLGESWLNQTQNLIAYTLKQLNRCHASVRISGLILCVDASELLQTAPIHLIDHCKEHSQLLERFGQGLGYTVDTAIILTKLDSIAGFCDFFQSDHPADLSKPLGFSLEPVKQRKQLIDNYRKQFDLMIEGLGQQIINKLHPARSTVKRTLIREFPLQLASLRIPVQSVIQNLPVNLFRIRGIYFTSAEQGGLSIDRLNERIQHEYALTVQDRFPLSNNYRAYFIEGALKALQDQTRRHIPQITKTQKSLAALAGGLVCCSLVWMAQQHIKSTRLIDETSRELLAYETLLTQDSDKTAALYHLSLASEKIAQVPGNFLSLSVIEDLKTQLNTSAKQRLYSDFLPEILAELEAVITNPSQNQIARYDALKIYLMLGEPEHFSETEVIQWFDNHWKETRPQQNTSKQFVLLRNALRQPMQPVPVNRQLISDLRNYLNALPATYLYYSLAKHHFDQSKRVIDIEGFQLASGELPEYYTKAGFKAEVAKLPDIIRELEKENWILARQDLHNLTEQLEEAYSFEYLTWWQNFVRHTKPEHYQDYQEAKRLAQKLHNSDSFTRLVTLIQEQTSPEAGDDGTRFNEKIASHFTSLNLMSGSAIKELSSNVNELDKFLTTIALVNDQGKTAFELTRSRFQGATSSDPLSTLYNHSRQLPEPVASWTKQLADDTWFIFINQSKNYLNTAWRDMVYNEYKLSIANRYPLDPNQTDEVSLRDFNRFFGPQGTLNLFVNNYLKPFLDTSVPQWQPKELNGYIMPVSADLTNELIRANVISNMFFPEESETGKIDFSLQKINLDPVIANLQLSLGDTKLTDNQNSESYTLFTWPQTDAKLSLYSIEGNHYELEEKGPWAFFKILQKVNVLVDSNDSSSLEILFEVNGNSGRYLLKTENQINPFSPGILTGFVLTDAVA